MQIDSSGAVHIAYTEDSNMKLLYAKSNGSSWEIDVIDIDSSDYFDLDPDLAISPGGVVYIAYCAGSGSDRRVKVAYLDDTDWCIQIVQPHTARPNHVDIEFGPDSKPAVAYSLDYNDIHYAHYGTSLH